MAEVCEFGSKVAINLKDEDVSGLQISMDDAAVMESVETNCDISR